MRRRTELICYGRGRPDELTAARRSYIDPDRIVVAKNDLSDGAPEGKGERKRGEREKNGDRDRRNTQPIHTDIVARCKITDAIVVGMEWLRAHPYLATIAAVAIVIIIGAIFVESHAPAALQGSSITWSGGTPVPASQNNYSYGQPATPQQIAQEVVQGGQGVNVAIPQIASSTPASSGFTPPSSSFNYTELLAALSAQGTTHVSANTTSGNANAVIQEAYQFIPQGLVAATTSAAKPKTAQQEALYEYGNEVGSEIQSFEELHTDQAEVLKDQAEDRTNPVKAAAVVSLGQALASIGTFMQGMQDVPPSVQSLGNSALCQVESGL